MSLSRAELQALSMISATLPKIALALERIAVHADRIAEALEADDGDEDSFDDGDEEESEDEGGE